MALVISVLEQGFADLPTTTDASLACDRIAAVYDKYAQAAQAGVTKPTFTGAEAAQFSSALFSALNTVAGTPASAGAGFVAAATAYWMTPPVVFGAGAVSGFVGGAILLAALEALFAAPNDTNTFATGLAAALDAATKTVTVLIGPSTFNLS